MRVEWHWILVSIGTSLGAALSWALANECKAWLAYFPKWLVRRAADWLPEDQRERYKEEWQSHINEMPGGIGKIVAAVGFVWAAMRMPVNSPTDTPIVVNLSGICRVRVNAVGRLEVRARTTSSAIIKVRLEKPPEQNRTDSTQG